MQNGTNGVNGVNGVNGHHAASSAGVKVSCSWMGCGKDLVQSWMEKERTCHDKNDGEDGLKQRR